MFLQQASCTPSFGGLGLSCWRGPDYLGCDFTICAIARPRSYSAWGHPKVVQELLGHSQISVTLDTYSHVLPDMQGQAMVELDDLLAQ